MNTVHVEVLLASGYAVFLVASATCLEMVGRHTRQRSRQYHTAGFTYHPHHNMWEVPGRPVSQALGVRLAAAHRTVSRGGEVLQCLRAEEELHRLR